MGGILAHYQEAVCLTLVLVSIVPRRVFFRLVFLIPESFCVRVLSLSPGGVTRQLAFFDVQNEWNVSVVLRGCSKWLECPSQFHHF